MGIYYYLMWGFEMPKFRGCWGSLKEAYIYEYMQYMNICILLLFFLAIGVMNKYKTHICIYLVIYPFSHSQPSLKQPLIIP